MSGGPTVLQIRVLNFVLTGIAVCATVFRLVDRTRTNRLWWDDAWAALTMVFLIVFMVANELHLEDPRKHSHNVKVAVYYMCAQFFSAVIWSSRISISFTVIRLAAGRLRQILVWVVGVFFITWGILFAQVWWVCEGNQSWKMDLLPQCNLGLSVAIAQVVTDVVCDLFLIVIPLRLVWRVKLTGAQRIRLTAVFSTTLITTGVGLCHAYFLLKKGGLDEALGATLQVSVSLIVANLSVIIAFIFRISTEEQETKFYATDTSPLTFGRKKLAQQVSGNLTAFFTTETVIHHDTDLIDLNAVRGIDSDVEVATKDTPVGNVQYNEHFMLQDDTKLPYV